MRVLLVAPPFNIFPVGISYISAALKRAGHDVTGHHFQKTENFIAELQKKYDVVATGGLSSQFRQLKNIVGLARSSNTPVIVGGGIITSEPELMSRSLIADYAVIGEGEETIVELLSCIKQGGNPSTVAGIGYFLGKQFVLTEPRKQNEDLDALPRPDYDCFGYGEFLDTMKPTDQYAYDIFDHPREYPLVSSRSCPFQCTFCYHPVGDKYRQRSLDSIMAELEVVVPKYRINIVGILDELFSYDEKRVLEFSTRFKKFADTLPWEVRWGCQMRVAGLQENMLDAMRNSGCYVVSYGFESYSQDVLKSMKKHITPQQIHHAVHATLDRRISIQANFIFGDKTETLATARETLDFWKDHPEAGILLAFIIACPNSAMYRYCIEKGIIQDRVDFITGHLFDILNMTSMSNADFYKLVTLVYKYTHKYSVYAIPLKRTPTSLTVRCPHCREVNEYKNYATSRFIYRKMMYCRHCRKRFFSISRAYQLFAKLIAHLLPPFSYRVYAFLQKIFGFARVPGWD